MTYTNYRDAQIKLAALEDFGGNTLSAETIERGASYVYIVKSYDTVIGIVLGRGRMDTVIKDWAGDRPTQPSLPIPSSGFMVTDKKYSVTTSKHQGYLRRAWCIENDEVIPEETFRTICHRAY